MKYLGILIAVSLCFNNIYGQLNDSLQYTAVFVNKMKIGDEIEPYIKKINMPFKEKTVYSNMDEAEYTICEFNGNIIKTYRSKVEEISVINNYFKIEPSNIAIGTDTITLKKLFPNSYNKKICCKGECQIFIDVLRLVKKEKYFYSIILDYRTQNGLVYKIIYCK